MILMAVIIFIVVIVGAFGFQCYSYRNRKHGAHD
jgi:hypothetical protein